MLSAQRHDQILAFISHLPHLAATQLVKVNGGNLEFAAGGFFDATRVASSDAEIWTDIFLSNRRFVVKAIDQYIKGLRHIRTMINKKDQKKLSFEMRKIKLLRDGLQKKN